MSFINHTPFPVMVWDNTDSEGIEYTTSLLRIKYRLKQNRTGEYTLLPASEQGELFGENIYYSDKVQIRYPSDFVPYKLYTDIILNASTYKPPHHNGGWYCSIELFSKHGQLLHQNRLEVLIPGHYKRKKWLGNWKFEKHDIIDNFPLRYTNGFGGEIGIINEEGEYTIVKRFDSNPVGKGLLDKDHPDDLIESPLFGSTEENTSNGFGAIDPSWSPRYEHSGEYNAQWEEEQHPLLPKNFNPMYYQSAHPNMILTSPSEEINKIHFDGIHPDAIPFSVTLPEQNPYYREESTTVTEEYELKIDTLIFDFDDEQIDNWSVFVCYRNRNKTIKSLKKRKIVFLSNKNVK